MSTQILPRFFAFIFYLGGANGHSVMPITGAPMAHNRGFPATVGCLAAIESCFDKNVETFSISIQAKHSLQLNSLAFSFAALTALTAARAAGPHFLGVPLGWSSPVPRYYFFLEKYYYFLISFHVICLGFPS